MLKRAKPLLDANELKLRALNLFSQLVISRKAVGYDFTACRFETLKQKRRNEGRAARECDSHACSDGEVRVATLVNWSEKMAIFSRLSRGICWEIPRIFFKSPSSHPTQCELPVVAISFC